MIGSSLPDHPALHSSLITYIGNKRALLSLIWEGLHYLETHEGPLQTMADPFTGSGVVARLGRLAGLEVYAGDIEDYTRPFGTAFLETTREEAEELYAPWGGYQAVLDHLNSLTTPVREEDLYFTRHYAPADTAAADPNRERLFYTRENALRIDAMAAAIHRGELGPADARSRRRDILLASLLVEMSVHNNTSGVMKGFHHGWGGRGGDALGRIMAPVELEALPFLEGPRGRMHVGPAHQLPHPADGRPFDVTYLDPPYTIHQYGANYHILTSAVRWDHYDPGPVARGSRAGIRTDHYRSDHCRSRGGAALSALQLVLERIRTRTVLVSYNNDGLIRPQDMLSLLSEEGAHTVHLFNRRYHKFGGGKSTQGAVGTREYLFVVRRGRTQDQAEREALRAEVQQLAAERDLHNRFMVPSVWAEKGGTVAHKTKLTGPDGESIILDDQLRVRTVQVPGDAAAAERAHRRMEDASGSPVEACRALLAMEDWDAALRVLQRLKIKKYRAEFLAIAGELDRAPLTPHYRQRLAALRERVTS